MTAEGYQQLIPNDGTQIVLHHDRTSVECLNVISDAAIFPGAFNPLHNGHRQLKMVAAEILNQRVIYELSVTNVAKSTLAENDLRKRLMQFDSSSVAVTRAPRFVDKARLFRGCCFVVGVDTAERILSTAFYSDSEAEMFAGLRQLQQCGNRFLVGGRLCVRTGEPIFVGLEDLSIPAQFEQMFTGIPEEQFREDVSSTELRR